MSLSCTVSKIQQDIAKNCQFYLIHLHFMPQLVVAPTEFAPRFLESKNYSPWTIVLCYLRDPNFSHSHITPTIIGAKEFKICHINMITSLSGVVCYTQVGTCY